MLVQIPLSPHRGLMMLSRKLKQCSEILKLRRDGVIHVSVLVLIVFQLSVQSCQATILGLIYVFVLLWFEIG